VALRISRPDRVRKVGRVCGSGEIGKENDFSILIKQFQFFTE
jgi:hypothetical protein